MDIAKNIRVCEIRILTGDYMAIQIYSKEFGASRNTSYYACEREEDVREKALKNVNEFFFKHDSVDIVNIIENWNEHRDFLKLVVYYKGYI